MTDTSYPVKAINGPIFSHNSFGSAYPPVRHQHHQPPADISAQDDEAISCVCGFADDDGWTVACDKCNRWQHQSCYYPQYDEIKLPEELEHVCVDCNPGIHVDYIKARSRQREKREQIEPTTNGIKRTAPKSHKKKVKEVGTVHTNGWPIDKLRHDRNSASPRDATQPPTKRPKTTHRTSDSTTTTNNTSTTKGHSRKRNASTANHRRSVSRSPDAPIDFYSEEFLERYRNADDWTPTEANLHNSIAVTNSLSEWLNLTEEEFQNEHNQQKGQVLMRWDGELDEIPGKAQVEIIDGCDDTVQYNGVTPSWKGLTVLDPVPEGAYIGELKGHVGFKKDYQDDTANRWSQLRHPEPFVFFHPQLPIFVDARNEGTELRFIRRSCRPNARLQILVTNSVDYHFCFMAIQEIHPGTEISVAWDTPQLNPRNGITGDQLDVLANWVSTALANCGPCACQLPEQECRMSRFDRRVHLEHDQQPKAPKGKKRKTGQHVSPINTNALNSRSGSEARKVDADEDRSDSRSTSGSAGRGTASRDITPNTHYSTNGLSNGAPELSERERKKLAKEEEIFRRQEQERAGKQAKKKRNSNGSTLNTPSATSSKQLGFPAANSKYVDSGNARQVGLSTAKAALGKKTKSQKGPGRPPNNVVRRPESVYVVHEVQCDLDTECAPAMAPSQSISTARRPVLTNRKKLLDLCARNTRAIAAAKRAHSVVASPATVVDKRDIDKRPRRAKHPPSSPVPVPATESSPCLQYSEPAAQNDIAMEDASVESIERSFSPHAASADRLPTLHSTKDDIKQSPPIDPPAPPWPPKAASVDSEASTSSRKPNTLHIDMPPPPVHLLSAAGQQSSSDIAGSTSNTNLQSPAALPALSPSVQSAVSSPPVKKKMSLSDYTRRKNALQPSSSTEGRATEGGSAIEEDVKMEDAGEATMKS